MWNNKKKKEQQAKDILTKQIGKLDDPSYPLDGTWKAETATFIKVFFGEDSDQYKFITKIILTDLWGIEIPGKRAEAKRFLKESIQIIERIGLYEPPKGNIFTTMSSEVIVTILLACIGGSFALGMYIGNITSNSENHELKAELRTKTDSIKVYRNYANKFKNPLKYTSPTKNSAPMFSIPPNEKAGTLKSSK